MIATVKTPNYQQMIDTLADRLCAEAIANNATLVAPPFVGAWTRKLEG